MMHLRIMLYTYWTPRQKLLRDDPRPLLQGEMMGRRGLPRKILVPLHTNMCPTTSEILATSLIGRGYQHLAHSVNLHTRLRVIEGYYNLTKLAFFPLVADCKQTSQ